MSTFWSNLLQQVLVIVLPILVSVGIAWLLALVVKEWQNVTTKYPAFAAIIDEYVPQVVAAAEQMRKAGLLPTGADAKAWAIKTMQGILDAHGASIIQVAPIEAAVEAAVADLPPFVAAPITGPGSAQGTTATISGTIDPAAPKGEPQEAAQQ